MTNPSGRLPFSVPKVEADLPAFDRDATSFRYDRWHGWWYLARQGTEPTFPFGFGLSYTTFEVADSDIRRDGDDLVVRAVVANNGDRDGADVVQVYAELPGSEIPPRLVGFQRVEVAAGSTAEARIVIPLERLAKRDPQHATWHAPSGRHELRVARHARDPHAQRHVLEL